MKRYLLIIFTYFGFLFTTAGQSYTFSQRTETYAEFSNGTVISSGLWGFGDIFTVTLPFSFYYFDDYFTTIYLTGGFAGFDYVHDNGADIFASHNLYVHDTDHYGLEDESPITYTTTGSAGSRIFKIQWKNARFENDDDALDYANFQLWLYEGSNKVEIHYGPISVVNPNSYELPDGGPTVAVLNDYFDYIILKGNPSNPTVQTPPYNNPDIFLTGSPANGQVYVFTPTNVTSTLAPSADQLLKASPNPFNERIIVSNESAATIQEIRLYDSEGRTIYSSSASFDEINTSGLVSGIYVLEIITDKGTSHKKLVK